MSQTRLWNILWNIFYTGGEISKRGGWFRLFGFGMRWVNHKYDPMLFSERYGYGVYLHVGQWCFKFFAPFRRGGLI